MSSPPRTITAGGDPCWTDGERGSVAKNQRETMKKLVPIAASLAVALAFCYFAINAVKRQPSLTDTFNRIYAVGSWGKEDFTGKGTSGSGSSMQITREYRA